MRCVTGLDVRCARGRCAPTSALALLLFVGCFKEETVEPGADGETSATGDPTTSTTAPITTTGSTTSTTDDTTQTSDSSTDPSTTRDPSADSSGDSSSTSTTTGDPDCEPDDPAVNFVDDFTRPDSIDLGNCWVEKDPGVWSLIDGDVVYAGDHATEYFDNMVFRDVSIRDVESSITLRVLTQDNRNEPHPMVRIQPSSFEAGTFYEAYALVPHIDNEMMSLCLMRFNAQGFIDAQTCEIVPPLVANDTGYTLTLRATGANPVQVYGRLDDLETKSVVATVEWNDASPGRISTAGAVGFSGGTINEVLNNFVISAFTSAPVR